MKKIFILTVLFFSLQSWTNADDISDFEIEGMSIGDSALNFFERNQIIKSFFPKSNKFFYSHHNIKNSEDYDQIQIYFKNNDEEYIIHGLRAGKLYYDNISKCLSDKKGLIKQVKKVLGSKIESESIPKYKHSNLYPNSFVHATHFEFTDGSLLRVYCMDFSEKVLNEKGWEDSLSAEVYNTDFRYFINHEAYD